MNNQTIIIIVVIFLIILFVKLFITKRQDNFEHLTTQSDEAVQNLASLYNKDQLTIGQLTSILRTSGKSSAPKIPIQRSGKSPGRGTTSSRTSGSHSAPRKTEHLSSPAFITNASPDVGR